MNFEELYAKMDKLAPTERHDSRWHNCGEGLWLGVDCWYSTTGMYGGITRQEHFTIHIRKSDRHPDHPAHTGEKWGQEHEVIAHLWEEDHSFDDIQLEQDCTIDRLVKYVEAVE